MAEYNQTTRIPETIFKTIQNISDPIKMTSPLIASFRVGPCDT